MTQTTTISDQIARLGGITARNSLAVTWRGTGYFAVTPKAPYDATLATAEQARQLLERADERLNAIGSARDRLLFCVILLRDIADVAVFNAVWDEWLAGTPAPARACFAAELANPALKVEMIMICASSDA